MTRVKLTELDFAPAGVDFDVVEQHLSVSLDPKAMRFVTESGRRRLAWIACIARLRERDRLLASIERRLGREAAHAVLADIVAADLKS